MDIASLCAAVARKLFLLKVGNNLIRRTNGLRLSRTQFKLNERTWDSVINFEIINQIFCFFGIFQGDSSAMTASNKKKRKENSSSAFLFHHLKKKQKTNKPKQGRAKAMRSSHHLWVERYSRQKFKLINPRFNEHVEHLLLNR